MNERPVVIRPLSVAKVQVLIWYAQLYLMFRYLQPTRLAQLTYLQHFKKVPVLWSVDHIGLGLEFHEPIKDEHKAFLYFWFKEVVVLDTDPTTAWVYIAPKRWPTFIAFHAKYIELKAQLATLSRAARGIDSEGDNV